MEKCRASPTTRLGIVAKARAEGVSVELPWRGLTKREYGRKLRSDKAKVRFEAMAPEEKSKVAARLAGKKRPGSARRQPDPYATPAGV